MYDYKKDDGQLSKKNDTGTFAGGNISSDFKVQKESLPQWAVDWARNRFNMDAKNVKFYVMDEQEADDSVALASGNSIFVTSDQRNDEEVIKHELTHIYQQAIGTATESNAGDTSLEDEAVQVSKEGNISLAKNQTQSGRYILPREKTNVVQSLGALAIAGLAVGGILTLGLIPLGVWLTKRIILAVKSGASLKTIGKIYDIFEWAHLKSEDLEVAITLCTAVHEKGIMEEQLEYDSKVLKNLSEYRSKYKSDNTPIYQYVLDYAEMLKNDFKGFKNISQGLPRDFKLHTEMFEYMVAVKKRFNFDEDYVLIGPISKNKAKVKVVVSDDNDNDADYNFSGENKAARADRESRMYYIYQKLHSLTKGFSRKDIEQIQRDIMMLFNCSLEEIEDNQLNKYIETYNKLKDDTEGISSLDASKLRDGLRIFFNKELIEAQDNEITEYIELFKAAKCFRNIEQFDFKNYITETLNCNNFWDGLEKVGGKSLVEETKCFEKITLEKFIEVRSELAEFLNIRETDTRIWKVLTDKIVSVYLKNIYHFSVETLEDLKERLNASMTDQRLIDDNIGEAGEARKTGNWTERQIMLLFDSLRPNLKLEPFGAKKQRQINSIQ